MFTFKKSNLFIISLIIFLVFYISLADKIYCQAPKTNDVVKGIVKNFISSSSGQNVQMIGLGSWISGGNYRDPLGNFKVPSDHDIRIVVPAGTTDDEALNLWKIAHNNLKEKVYQKFGPVKAQKILESINVYPPEQLVKGVKSSQEAADLLNNVYKTNPNLGGNPVEGLFKDSSKGWKQAYEAKKGRLFYFDKKSGVVVTTAPDLVHAQEGLGKITMGGMAETADDWIEHLDDAIKKRDPIAIKKYLQRIDSSLEKSKDLARISQDDYLKKIIDKIDDSADDISDELLEEINAGVRQAKFESKALNVLSKGNFDKYSRIIAGILERNNPKWAKFKNALSTISENIPIDTLLQGVFMTFDAYQATEAYKDGDTEGAFRNTFASIISSLGLHVAIPAALTNAIIEDAKENGYILMVSRQDCEGLLVGECNMIGRTSVLQEEDKVFTKAFETILAEKDPKTDAEFDSVFGPIIQYNARKCADRGFNGKISDFVDERVGDACWARCSGMLRDKWNKARVGQLAEQSAMAEQFKAEVLNSTVNINYEPDPILLPEDPKAPQVVSVKFAGDFSGNEKYLSELLTAMADVVKKQTPAYHLKALVTYKWFVDGIATSTVETFLYNGANGIFDQSKGSLTHKFSQPGKHHITLKYAIRFQYVSNHPDLNNDDSIYKRMDAFYKNLLMIKQGELDINVEKPVQNPKEPDKKDPQTENKDTNNSPENQDINNNPVKPDPNDIQLPQDNRKKNEGTNSQNPQQPDDFDTTITPTQGKTLRDHIKDLSGKTGSNLGQQTNLPGSTTQINNPLDNLNNQTNTPPDNVNTQPGEPTNNSNTPEEKMDPTDRACDLYRKLEALRNRIDNQISQNSDLVDKVNNERIDLQNTLAPLYKANEDTSSFSGLISKFENLEQCLRNLRAEKQTKQTELLNIKTKVDDYMSKLVGCVDLYRLGDKVDTSKATLNAAEALINNSESAINNYALNNNCSQARIAKTEEDTKPTVDKTPVACKDKGWQELYSMYASSRNDNDKATIKGCIENQFAKIPPFYENITNRYRQEWNNLKGECEAFKTRIKDQIKLLEEKIAKLENESNIAYKNKEYDKSRELIAKANVHRAKIGEINQCADIPSAKCTMLVHQLEIIVSGNEWGKSRFDTKDDYGLPAMQLFMKYETDKNFNMEEELKKYKIDLSCSNLDTPQNKDENDEEDETSVVVEADKTEVEIGETVNISARVNSKKGTFSCSDGLNYNWSGQNIGSGGNIKNQNSISFNSSKPGKYTVGIAVSCGGKSVGSSSVSIEVKGGEVKGKISGLPDQVYYGSNKNISLILESESGSNVPRSFKALWNSSPNLKFDPQEGSSSSTTVTFDRMSSPTSIWAEVTLAAEDVADLRLSGEIGLLENYEGKPETKIKTENKEVEVIAPEFTFKYDPPANEAKIGQPVKVEIIANPAVDKSIIDYRWIEPTDRKELDTGVIEIVPKDTKPIKIQVNARVPSYGDTIKDNITDEFTAAELKVTAKVIKAKYDIGSKVWKEGQGQVDVEKGFLVDQDILLGAEVEGAKKEDVKFEWSVKDDTCHIVAGEISDQVTMNKSEPGSCDATVVVYDKENRKLGEASVSFSVVSQDDEKLTEPIINKAKKLVEEGKLDEAIAELSAGLVKFPKSKSLNEYYNRLKSEKEQVLKHIEDLKNYINQEKITEAETELAEATKLHPKYQPVIDAENLIKEAKTKLATKKLEEAQKLASEDKLDEALPLLQEAVALDPGNASITNFQDKLKGEIDTIKKHLDSFNSNFSQEQYEKAEEDLKVPNEMHPKYKPVVDANELLKTKKDNKNKAQAAKLFDEATALAQQDKLDEAIAKAEEAKKLDPARTDIKDFIQKIKTDKTTCLQQTAKVKALTDQKKFDDALKELQVAQNLRPQYQPVKDVANYLETERKKYEEALKTKMSAAQKKFDEKDFSGVLSLITTIKQEFKLDATSEKTLKDLEDNAKKAIKDKALAKQALQNGETQYNSYDYNSAMTNFRLAFETYKYVWSGKEPEIEKYGEMMAHTTRFIEYLATIKPVVQNNQATEDENKTALGKTDQILSFHPANPEVLNYKKILQDRLNAKKNDTVIQNKPITPDNATTATPNAVVPIVPENIVPIAPPLSTSNNVVPIVQTPSGYNNVVPIVPGTTQLSRDYSSTNTNKGPVNVVPFVPNQSQSVYTPNNTNTLSGSATYSTPQPTPYPAQNNQLLNQYLSMQKKTGPGSQAINELNKTISTLNTNKQAFNQTRNPNAGSSPNGNYVSVAPPETFNSDPRATSGFDGFNTGTSTGDRIRTLSNTTKTWSDTNKIKNNPPSNTSAQNIPTGDGAPETDRTNGADDDGDGVIDEGPMTGNCQIAIHDTGGDKDDQWSLTVDGNSIGVNNQGKTRFWDLNLSRGTHTVTATGSTIPDNVGTYTLWFGRASVVNGPPLTGENLNQGITFTWQINVQ